MKISPSTRRHAADLALALVVLAVCCGALVSGCGEDLEIGGTIPPTIPTAEATDTPEPDEEDDV